MDTEITTIDDARKLLATITEVTDARKFLSLARGFATTAAKEYKAASTISDSKEDRDHAYNLAIHAAELRLKAEARLGELIKVEQEAGRLAIAGGSRGYTGETTLKQYGLSKQESSRAQQIAEHQELISQAVENAKRIKDIPTRKSLELIIRNLPKTSVPPSPVPLITESDDRNIICGDYSVLYDKLEDDSVDLFFTDPPYNEADLLLYAELAKLAQAKLKPGGLCIAYSAHPHLPKIIENMKQHLNYWWIFAIFQTGAEPRIWSRKIWVGWKPLLAFSKKPTNGRVTDTWFRDSFRDTTIGSGEDKRYHKWGQDVQEATYWIEMLTNPGGLIVDPFTGGGTIPLACKLTNRQWLATDNNFDNVSKARQRIVESKINDSDKDN